MDQKNHMKAKHFQRGKPGKRAGTAIHKILELWPFKPAVETAEEVQSVLDGLSSSGRIPADLLDYADRE